MRGSKAVLSVMVLTVVLAGCANDARSEGGLTTGTQTPNSVTSPSGGAKILSFEAPKLGGGQVDGDDLRGKDVAIWFWAPW